MSEAIAAKRSRAGRTADAFPCIFRMIARGELHLSTVHQLAAHLTEDETAPPGLAYVGGGEGPRQFDRAKLLKTQTVSSARFVLCTSCMTQPRMVLRGATSMVTRRTLRRHHLFRPDPAIAQLYLYTLGICAMEFGVELHAFVLMSTHEHLVLTDPNERLPDFLRRLHRLVALGTKVLRKWEGAVWDHERPSVVRLLTERAVIEKMAYVLANPVKAGLVQRAAHWPGVTVLPQELGRRTWKVKRPDFFFDADNPNWPDEVELMLTTPPTLRLESLLSAGPMSIRKS